MDTEPKPQQAFRIFDRLQEIYWSNPKGKTVFGRVTDAKLSWNAWNADEERMEYMRDPRWRTDSEYRYNQTKLPYTRFNDQTRYVVRRFNLVFDAQLTHAAFGELNERSTRKRSR